MPATFYACPLLLPSHVLRQPIRASHTHCLNFKAPRCGCLQATEVWQVLRVTLVLLRRIHVGHWRPSDLPKRTDKRNCLICWAEQRFGAARRFRCCVMFVKELSTEGREKTERKQKTRGHASSLGKLQCLLMILEIAYMLGCSIVRGFPLIWQSNPSCGTLLADKPYWIVFGRCMDP